MRTQTFTSKARVLVLAVLVAPLGLLAQDSGPQLPNPGSPKFVNRQQQEKLGLQAMGEVYQQFPVLPDSSPVTQYVQQLGRRLVAVIPQQQSWPYQFHVIPAKDINAFALPGGPIFINIGAIQAAGSEAELAGVMSHEMSHVYMQHSAKAMSKQATTQIFAGILGAVLPGTAGGDLARLGIQIGAGTILMKYSRTDEAQADGVGAIIMYKAGYNPKAMADFFSTLQKKAGSGGPQFLSDHPNPGNRELAIDKEIRDWPSKNYQAQNESFLAAQQKATQVKTYTAQEITAGAKQGVWAQQNRQSGAVPPTVGANSGGSSPPPPRQK